jgi:hypothetical protein
MPNQLEWMPPPPTSANGWGQAVSYQLFALRRELDQIHDRLRDYVPGATVVSEAHLRREIDRIYQEIDWVRSQMAQQSTAIPKQSLMSIIRDFLVANAWQIGLAIFALGAAIGKTGKFPDPVGLLLGAVKGIAGS